jgi:hypothetical protein
MYYRLSICMFSFFYHHKFQGYNSQQMQNFKRYSEQVLIPILFIQRALCWFYPAMLYVHHPSPAINQHTKLMCFLKWIRMSIESFHNNIYSLILYSKLHNIVQGSIDNFPFHKHNHISRWKYSPHLSYLRCWLLLYIRYLNYVFFSILHRWTHIPVLKPKSWIFY